MRVEKPGYRGVIWWLTNECFSGYEIPETREAFDKVFDDCELFVVHDNDVVKGYAIVRMGKGSLTGCYLQSIAVHPIYQRQGLGAQLMQEVAKYCLERNEVAIRLHCKKASTVVEFYEDQGYKVTEILEDFYLSDGDGLEMRKVL